jgi:hypothetical protein
MNNTGGGRSKVWDISELLDPVEMARDMPGVEGGHVIASVAGRPLSNPARPNKGNSDINTHAGVIQRDP